MSFARCFCWAFLPFNLNLALIRQAAEKAQLPFLNIAQTWTWTPSMRVPNADEMRYLVYTTLAYGAPGISYRQLSFMCLTLS